MSNEFLTVSNESLVVNVAALKTQFNTLIDDNLRRSARINKIARQSLLDKGVKARSIGVVVESCVEGLLNRSFEQPLHVRFDQHTD